MEDSYSLPRQFKTGEIPMWMSTQLPQALLGKCFRGEFTPAPVRNLRKVSAFVCGHVHSPGIIAYVLSTAKEREKNKQTST